MSLNTSAFNSKPCRLLSGCKPFSGQHNKGFLLPLAAILIVGIGGLAVAIGRIHNQANHSSIFEGLSLQAFYAAESGVSYGLTQVLFDQTNRTAADASCTSLSTTLNFTVTGLSSCSASVSCRVAVDSGNTTSLYTVISSATCGEGEFIAERTVEAAAVL